MSLAYKLTDAIPKPSLSVMELNNALVKMRKVVKAAKVLIYRDIKRYIRLLGKKVERAPENMRLQKKMEHRSEELGQLRGLTVSRLCKLLMASDYTEQSLSHEGGRLDGQERLLVRLSRAKPVAAYLTTFREEHPDWRSLGQYLLYKNVSGKWKSRQQKKRNRLVHGAVPLPQAPSDSLAEDQPSERETPVFSIQQLCATLDPSENGAHPTSTERISPPPHVDDDDIDEIADQVVTRLLAKAGDKPKPNPEKTKMNFCGLTMVPLPAADHQKRENCKILGRKFERLSGRRKADKSPEDATKSRSSEQDDDHLFGSDDVEMRKSLSRRERQQRPTAFHRPINSGPRRAQRTKPPSAYSRPPRKPLTHAPRPKALPTAEPPKKKPEQETMENLHPSWQAKREQKFRLSSLANLTTGGGGGSASGQAKHTVFED